MSNQPFQWTATQEQVSNLNATIIKPHSTIVPTEMIVLCHGYGAPGDDLVGIADPLIRELQKKQRNPILVFPEAPVDLEDYGMPGGRAWWPLNMARLMELAAKNDFSEMRSEVPPGIDDARSMLVEFTQELMNRFSIDEAKLTLGGFSQGAMLAVDAALRGLDKAPAHLAVMSGALICEPIWRAAAGRLETMKVIQTHGRFDTILPIQTGRWLNSLFRDSCRQATFHEFDGPHTIPMQAIEMIAES
ncbi:MAG: lysophospholipase [Pirellulaceae bacterium]|nr:lysophospholipase [Pirellulaceae bacterium]